MGPLAAALRQRLQEHKADIERAAQSMVNRLAMQGVRDIQAEMRRVFDRPRRETLNALKWVDGQVPSFAATIDWRDDGFVGKGTLTPSRWIAIHMTGGVRRQKGSELRLQRARAVGQPIYLVPTKYAPVDAYGNVPGPRMVKILSDLEALGGEGQGFDGNRRAGKRSRGRRRAEYYFAIWPGSPARRSPGGRLYPNNLPPAIYQRFGEGQGSYIRPIFVFARSAPKYAQRLDVTVLVQETIRRHAPEFFLRSLRREVLPSLRGLAAVEVPSVRL